MTQEELNQAVNDWQTNYHNIPWSKYYEQFCQLGTLKKDRQRDYYRNGSIVKENNTIVFGDAQILQNYPVRLFDKGQPLLFMNENGHVLNKDMFSAKVEINDPSPTVCYYIYPTKFISFEVDENGHLIVYEPNAIYKEITYKIKNFHLIVSQNGTN